MTEPLDKFLAEHSTLTRRYFLRQGTVGVAALAALPNLMFAADRDPLLQEALNDLETWLTEQDDFRDVSRGNPRPHSLDEAKRKEVGLTRDTWQLEVASDPEKRTLLKNSLTKAKGNAFNFKDLMSLAEKHAVRFPKVMTCLNLGCPLGNGIWEGVPLREVIWLTQPGRDLRRIFYHGYHNDDPKQMFRSSLPAGRVLKDYFGLPPVILCYKLNGQWLSPERGGPVRVVVPEAYGFKNIKWLSHVFLSNQWKANDTYGEQNNDVDSPLKTFCEVLSVPNQVKPSEPLPITGYAQVGIAGLRKVQVWLQALNDPWPREDKYFINAPWKDAELLPPPKQWGGGLPDNKIPDGTRGFDQNTRQPTSWPMNLSKVHWATLLPGVPAGEYMLRCRTIDANGAAQPMPRPFRKSGRAAIQNIPIRVSD